MLIKTEDLYPKRIINFYLPKAIAPAEMALLFAKNNKCKDGFVAEISALDGLEHFLITTDVISVAYNEKADKEDVKALVLAITDDYLSQGVLSALTDDAELSEKCEAVADAFIRPTLNRDKGDILIENVGQNSAAIRFVGHCADCPYAQSTLQNVIVRTFQRYLPQIKDLRLKE